MSETEYSTIEIELNELTKEELIKLVQLSAFWNLPIDKVFEQIITEYVDKFAEETTLL